MSMIPSTAYTKTDKAGALAVTAGAAIWGLFWLPLRYLNEAGVKGLWAVALVMAAAVFPALLCMWQQRELGELRKPGSWLAGLAIGTSAVLYFTGILYSDVIRVIFLFYLLPLWTTLSARLIYGEPIRTANLLVIAAALTGVWLLLGGGSQLPLPQNVGDWCAIAAGLCWGVSLSLLRAREQTPAFAGTAAAIFIALVLSTAIAAMSTVMADDSMNHSRQAGTSTAWPTIIALGSTFSVLMLYPSLLGQIWGARRIPAPTAALLTMTEIVVATLSAGILIGSELSPISWLGGAIIVAAVCLDLLVKRSGN